MDDKDTGAMDEIGAMQKVAEAVKDLDAEATGRVLRWAAERYGVAAAPAPRKGHAAVAGGAGATAEPEAATFETLAELCSAASPKTDADRALLAGYWLQTAESQSEFTSQAVNSELKHLGHPVSNITSAFEQLKSQRPALVVQLKKSGTTKQARKTFKLTVSGINAVNQMIGADAS